MRDLLARLRDATFTERTRDRLYDVVVFVLVPAMCAAVIVLLMQVGSWMSAAQEREQIRADRMRNAVEEVVNEIRQPEGDGSDRDTREETFDRIRQLCELHPECDP